MSSIRRLIRSSQEELLQSVFQSLNSPLSSALDSLSLEYDLNKAQTLCGLGFNPVVRSMPDILETLGFRTYEDLAHERNRAFTSDIYKLLGIRDILIIFETVATDPELLDVMQYLLVARLDMIEKHIEKTVSSLVIERYKKEVKAIYTEGVARIEFAESRLDKTDSGFRALVNEVDTIISSRLIPVGDIFFRASILPEERRRMIQRHNIPAELIRQRLQDPDLEQRERQILFDALEKQAT